MLEKIAKKIKEADAILIGASNGLSITEGLNLFANDEKFEDIFGEFKRQYGIENILQGMMGRWSSEESKWAFWSKLIKKYCIDYKPTQVMKDLKTIIGKKEYFIITSNGEGHFQLNGFDENKIYEIEGNWLKKQCEERCHDKLYSTLDLAEKINISKLETMAPTGLVPKCPKCGSDMKVHMIGENYIPDTKKKKLLEEFLDKYSDKNLIIIELGIGWRNQLIKAPLMNITAKQEKATYVTINLGEVYIREDIRDKSFGIDGYLSEVISDLRKACENENSEKN